MKYYKHPVTNEVWAFAADGSQDKDIPEELIAITEAEADALRAPTPQQTVLLEILQLESLVTQRRLREATLGTDGGWLANIEQQIAALREQL